MSNCKKTKTLNAKEMKAEKKEKKTHRNANSISDVREKGGQRRRKKQKMDDSCRGRR